MDYEKEYKSLVAKVKKAHLFAQTDSTKMVLEDILPELRESEDETTRKELLDFVKCFWADHKEKLPQTSRWVTYLENLKEQKPAEIDEIIRKARSEGRQEVIDNPEYYQLLKKGD